jgi:hypothetical protein
MLSLALLAALKDVQFYRAAEGVLAKSPSIARKPHHAREARASNRRREPATTTLKGLGGIGPAFEGKRSSAGSLAQNTRKADNQTI